MSPSDPNSSSSLSAAEPQGTNAPSHPLNRSGGTWEGYTMNKVIMKLGDERRDFRHLHTLGWSLVSGAVVVHADGVAGRSMLR